MPQCKKYPKGCNGLVRIDDKDKSWYCEAHYYEYVHLKETGRKISKNDNKLKKEKEKDE